MPKIKYIEHNGKEHDVEVPEGWSVMEIANRLDLPPARVSDEKYKGIAKLREQLTI